MQTTPPPLPLRDNEIARRDPAGLVTRPTPFRLRIDADGLVSADGHRVGATFSCGMQILTAAAEQKVFAETFLAVRGIVTLQDVIAHFAPAVRDRLAAMVQGKAGMDLLQPAGRDEVKETARKAAEGVAFACGLEALAPLSMELRSPTLEQQRLTQLQQALGEQRSASQLEQFRRAADMLKQFEELRAATPGIRPADILKHVSPADQGQMLQMLLLASAQRKRTETLWAVAGPQLLRIELGDTRGGEAPLGATVVGIPLSTDLGPLRSVEVAEVTDQRMLLVGARSGVMIVDPISPSQPRMYADQSISTQFGFSHAICWGGRLWACHSDAGVVAWDLAVPGRPPVFAVRPTSLVPAGVGSGGSSGGATHKPAVRNLCRLDESRLVFSVGPSLFTVDASGATSPLPSRCRGNAVAILPADEQLMVVSEDGDVLVLSREGTVLSQTHPAGKLLSAALLPWLSASRLLLATCDGAVQCLGMDDGIVTSFQSPYRGLRSVSAAADLIVAISPDRQRLILWRPWESRKPTLDLSLSAIARHRVGDVSLA